MSSCTHFQKKVRSPMYFVAVRKKKQAIITQNSLCQLSNRKKWFPPLYTISKESQVAHVFYCCKKNKTGNSIAQNSFCQIFHKKKMSSSFVHNLKRKFSSAAYYQTKAWFRTKQINVLTNFKEKPSFHRKLHSHICEEKS